VFVGLFLPGAVMAVQLATDTLGPRQVNALIHWTGLWTIRLVLLSLAITPFRLLLDWPSLPLVRRMVGVAATAYGLAHLGLYIVDQNFHLLQVGSEIARRFYLTIGFVALLGLVALGVTSTDAAVRRMGRNWKRLHRAIYAIGALAVWHAALQSKANVSEAILMGGLLAWLLLWRLLPAGARRRWPVLLALSVVSAGATAGIEFGWYALATRIPPNRVLAANLDIAWDALRPAHWVLIVTLAAALAAAVVTPSARRSLSGGAVRKSVS
jgi:sulfoxide reductase heme-binding subunit YedZ